MDELENSAENLRRALDELANSGSLSDDSLNRLNRTQTTLSRTTEKLIRGTTKVVGEMYDYGRKIKENRDSVQSLNPAIDSVTGAFNLLGPVAGALGDALGGVAKVATELADETLQAYVEAANVGATGAEAMTKLRDQATLADTNVRTFARMLTKSAQDLSFAFGSTSDGADMLSKTMSSLENTGAREALFNLGYGMEQITELTSEYAKRQTLLGFQQDRDYRRLAKSAENYLYELDTLAKLTGKSREEISREIDERNADVRFLAWQRNQRKKNPETAANTIAEVNKGLSAIKAIAPEMEVAFMDAMNGFGPAADKVGLLGEDALRATQELSKGAITAEEFVKRVSAAANNSANNLDNTAMLAGKQLGIMDDVYSGSARLAGAADEMLAAMQKSKDATAQTATGSDEMAANLAKLQTSLLQQASVFQKFDDKLTELVDGPLSYFGEKIAGLAEFIGEKTGITDEPTGTEPGRATGGPIRPNTTYVVGEFGPELVQFDQQGTVIPNSELTQITDPKSRPENTDFTQDVIAQVQQTLRQRVDSIERIKNIPNRLVEQLATKMSAILEEFGSTAPEVTDEVRQQLIDEFEKTLISSTDLTESLTKKMQDFTPTADFAQSFERLAVSVDGIDVSALTPDLSTLDLSKLDAATTDFAKQLANTGSVDFGILNNAITELSTGMIDANQFVSIDFGILNNAITELSTGMIDANQFVSIVDNFKSGLDSTIVNKDMLTLADAMQNAKTRIDAISIPTTFGTDLQVTQRDLGDLRDAASTVQQEMHNYFDYLEKNNALDLAVIGADSDLRELYEAMQGFGQELPELEINTAQLENLSAPTSAYISPLQDLADVIQKQIGSLKVEKQEVAPPARTTDNTAEKQISLMNEQLVKLQAVVDALSRSNLTQTQILRGLTA